MKEAKRKQMIAVVTPLKADPELVDEITIGDWLHLEAMDIASGKYYLRVGDNYFDIIIPYTGTSIEVKPQ